MNTQDVITKLAEQNASFIHAHGKRATEYLLEELNLKRGDMVLEFGFGTGATIIEVASRFPDVKLFGVEANLAMYRKATKRFKVCGVDNRVKCILNSNKLELPFETASIDTIYCESVLAILEGKSLEVMIKEFSRVLKEGGMLLMNETIWLDSTSNDIIEKLNSYCKSNYGIIQSNSAFPYRKDWIDLLQLNSLNVICTASIDDVVAKKKRSRSWKTTVSNLYTMTGKIRQVRNKQRFTPMEEVLGISHQLMEGVFFKVQKSN